MRSQGREREGDRRGGDVAARAPALDDSDARDRLLALQRAAGNCAVSRMILRQDREGAEREREIAAGSRAGAHGGERGRTHLTSDWAGREIVARWLSGEGDWDVDDDRWSAYMRAHRGLRARMARHARHLIGNVAALGYDEGVVPVSEEFPIDIENGEGIIGYEYLHGTNATVGGYQINGWARLVPGPVPATPEPLASTPNPSFDHLSTSADRQVHWYLEYTWNDMIDPNAQYASDILKSMFGRVVSLGSAQDYRISITWRGEGVARVNANGNVRSVARPQTASGARANLYPLDD